MPLEQGRRMLVAFDPMGPAQGLPLAVRPGTHLTRIIALPGGITRLGGENPTASHKPTASIAQKPSTARSAPAPRQRTRSA